MKFTGCVPIKSLEPVIELSNGGVIWDLHNVGELQEFKYLVKERALTFDWRYFDLNGNLLDKIVRLKFCDISSFEITARDPLMPYSEDDCLSEIVFDEEFDSFELNFMGGQKIRIFCDELQFVLINK